MTKTSEELTNSSIFWKMRIEQQMDYITSFATTTRTRPDKDYVLTTAFMILEQCQFYYLSAYILEQIGDILTEQEIRNIFNDHVDTWNVSSIFSKVVKHPRTST